MASNTKPALRFIGCDVGKREIVAFDTRTERTRTVPNTADALAAFAGELDDTCLVVCEATGGYERLLLAALLAAGRAVHRADARKVKAFIRSFGILGKSDGIDARALARYGAERHHQLVRWRMPQQQRARLQALVGARSDLVGQRVALNNRLQAPGADLVAHHLEPLLQCFDQQIAALEAEIDQLIAAEPELARAAGTLREISGIGPRTAAALLALMPELGALTGKQAAALAGLAPHPRQSGASDASRPTRGGRPEVKRALFLAAMSAAKHNPKLKAFYERLIANGKKRLVALVAVMRKLIVIGNARLRPVTDSAT
ncbi:MAG: IS110 family transposase [Acetobacteraceae bacterium]